MRNVVRLGGFFLMQILCITNFQTISTEPQKQIEIIETTPIEPNPVILLKEEVRYTQHWDEGCSDNTIQISYEDAQILLKIAAAEAGGEDVDGQLIVMETVWNRVMSDDPYYPDTIREVVSQKDAFTTVTNGIYGTVEPNSRTHLALAKFEANLNHDDLILGFETKGHGRKLLNYFDYYYTHGNHDVFKAKEKD